MFWNIVLRCCCSTSPPHSPQTLDQRSVLAPFQAVVMLLTSLEAHRRSWPSIPGLIKSYRMGKKKNKKTTNRLSNGKDKLANPHSVKSLLLPIHLKLNLYASLETSAVESGAVGTDRLLPAPSSTSADQ